MNIEIFGMADQFTLEDAFDLLNRHVIKKEHEHISNPPIDKIGFIAGVITLNDEVEVMVKFSNELMQLTKSAFTKQIKLLDMP